MRILKYIFVTSLVLLVAACSNRSPEPLIKEEVQTSAQEDFELLKESTANAPMEIDLYQALAIAIKNNRELRIQVMDSALSQGQIDVVKFDMLPKLSANAGYKVLEKHPSSSSETILFPGGRIDVTFPKLSLEAISGATDDAICPPSVGTVGKGGGCVVAVKGGMKPETPGGEANGLPGVACP